MRWMAGLAAVLICVASARAQVTRLELGPDGTWIDRATEAADADEAAMREARRLIAASGVRPEDLRADASGASPPAQPAKEAETTPPGPEAGASAVNKAFAILDPWIEAHRRTSHPLLAEAYLLRGDAWVAAGNEWQALYDYEALARQFPGSDEFVRAVERELEIGIRYANGLRRKQFGLRFVDATSEGRELLMRVSERMPESALAERAQIELADSYLRTEEWDLATETYEIFLVNFPRSVHRQRAMKNLVAGHVRGYKGPQYDGRGLLEARALVERFRDDFPADADRAGLTQDLINRVDEQLAAQSLARARSHERRGDAPAARLVLRRLVQRHPGTVAARQAAEMLRRRGWDDSGRDTPAAPMPPGARTEPPRPRRRRGCRSRPPGSDGHGAPARLLGLGAAAGVLGVLGACSSDPSQGYSFKSTFVENVRSVAVPMAENRTFNRGLEVSLTEAVIKEIQRSTPWVVVGREGADAVLTTTITDSSLRALSVGRVTGMSQEMAVQVTIDFDLRMSGSGRTLVSRRGFQGVGTFVPAYGTQERLELGQSVSVQELARDIVAELRSNW